MLEKLKSVLPELAREAVLTVEENLTGETGKVKKSMAVKFVIDHLPVHSSIKSIVGYIFAVFIDSAIEIAVEFMKQYGSKKSIED